MAVTNTPIFVQGFFSSGNPVAITAAITSLTAGTGATTIVTGGSNGSRVDGIQFVAVESSSDGWILVYLHDGSAAKMIDYIRVTAHAGFGDKGPWKFHWRNPMTGPLASGDSLRAGLYQWSGTIHATPLGGDY